MFNRIRIWFESEKDAVPLSIVFLTSPLSPLSTLHKLKRLGLYSYLPEPSQLLDHLPDSFSSKMRETLRVAILSHKSGSREVINQKLSEVMSRTETELEIADYNISQLYQFISVFTTLVPSIIASVLFFMNLKNGVITIISAALFSVMAGFLGLTVFPGELRLPSPPKRYLALFLIVAPLYFIFNFELKLLLLISLASLIPSFLSWIFLSNKMKILREARELVRKANTTTFNLFKALEIEDPDFLLARRWFGIARAATTSLYLLALHGGGRLSDSLNLLESYYSRYLNALDRIRSKTRVMMFYSVIEALVIAGIYAILVYTLLFFANLPRYYSEAYTGAFYIPSTIELEFLKKSLDLVLTLNAFGLSIATSTSREGNPLYFTLYLPVIGFAMWIGYTMAFLYAPQLFGG
ncbi:MAG: hypothetical protein DRZ80_02300 [Thermoprotei archaeon]|nr:MAG: hypothetical protein DRZ80_02300 [Thermoprotei archaeon]